MLKKILCCILAFALTFTVLPMAVFARTNNILYGDVNADGEITVKDILIFRRYIAEEEPSDFIFVNADVNVDNIADMADLLMIKKFLAEWDIHLGPELLTVSFYDGERLIDVLDASKGYPLGEVPSNDKSSKADGILVGYFTDEALTVPFYAENPVESNMKVYAKYEDMESATTVTPTSFAQMDMEPNLSFEIVRETGDTPAQTAATLTAKDGSDPVSITAEDSDGDGVYTVSAPDGFKEGCSYELTLADGWNFKGKESSIRTASFSIKKDIVENLTMSSDTHFVKHSNPSLLQAGDTISVDNVKTGDLICFYKKTNPKERDYKSGNAYMDDPEIWFKAGEVLGDKVTLEEMGEDDREKIYDVPDNFPVNGKLPEGDGGTLTLTPEDSDGYALDTEVYGMIVEEDENNLETALSKVSVGDFVSIYVSQDELQSESNVYFGKVTYFNSETGVITFVKSSAEEIETSMDLYIQPVLEGDDLISEEAKEDIEATVLAQIKEGGFAEEAGFVLAELASKTDGFRNMDGVQVFLTDENGESLSDDEIALLNLGKSFELSDDIELSVEIITSGDQLHFKDKGSVQLAIGIGAQFEVDAEDDGKIAIDLDATFAQELGIGVTAKGELVKKKILGIPIPIGVKLGSSVDLLSYTGVRVDVHAYTVAEEDENLWDQVKGVLRDPTSLADALPDSDKFAKIKNGLNTVGDVFAKIDEVMGKIEQVRNDAETAKGYAEDLEMLWEMVDEMDVDGLPTKEQWEKMGQTLGKTNVSEDLMDMLDLATETELDTGRYAEGLEDLLTRYSEMLEEETNWVKLVQKEICQVEINICGLVIYAKADFVVRADMNIAMGASLQYQVGKRYTFWVKVGLFKPEAGSSTIDLVDEQFAFQFYVMGKLGIKMGVEATAGFAIGSADLARVGIHLELGPYVKLYGFFIYEYERTRESNATSWVSDERMAGALYVDFGLYLILGVDAEALSLFEASYDFIDEEFPLLEAGEKKYPYAFRYEPMKDELVLVQDEDGNSSNGITMPLPEEYLAVKYCNLTTGKLGSMAYEPDSYFYTVSNPNFSVDENGVISVTVPSGTRYMECDLTITYKYRKLAFSRYDMQVTVPLVWTNLATDELTQYYTASVRVGNDTDGYDTVWSKRVRKNQEFTLLTEEELKELIGYDETVYSGFDFQAAGQTDTLIDNKTYDCTVSYTDYAVTVSGIQNADGTTHSETFHTNYGETFNFSSLIGTGTDTAGTYTKFIGVTTEATVTANGQEQVIDLTQPITGKVADAIRAGAVSASADYADDSARVTYTFTGLTHDDIEMRVRKGTEPSLDEVFDIAKENGLAVKDISPAVGKVTANTTYQVVCGELDTPFAELVFNSNGGNSIASINDHEGALVNLPTPVKEGYTFDGWFTDNGTFQNEFAETKMPVGGATLYAKLTANEYQVTLHVNGGDHWNNSESPVTVTYDSTYGILPAPTRDGYSFIGWFTEQTGGTQVNANTKVTILAAQTLYAHWKQLKTIPGDVFDFGTAESGTYQKGQTHEVLYEFSPEENETYKLDDFTFKYMRQGNSEYESGLPINAGTYNVTISRPADNDYAKFEQTYTAVIIIDKATRSDDVFANADITPIGSGLNYIEFRLNTDSIDDFDSENTMIIFTAAKKSGNLVIPGESSTSAKLSVTETARIKNLLPGVEYAVTFRLMGDPNYNDYTCNRYMSTAITTVANDTSTNWVNYTEAFKIDNENKTVTIENEAQLAYLAKTVNAGTAYNGYSFTLARDLNLLAHAWTPVGTTTYQFQGSFNGAGHTIYGLHTSGAHSAGIFGRTRYGTIQNITVAESYISGRYNAGAVAGAVYDSARVFNCVNESTVVGLNDYDPDDHLYGTGGVVGNVYNSAGVSGLINNGRVDGVCQTGGVVGCVDHSGVVANCVNNGPVKGTSNHTGGVAGFIQDSYLMNSVNTGSVTGVSAVGGVAGQADTDDSYVLNCYTIGTVKGTDKYVGACVGRNRDKGANHHLYYLQNSATCNGNYRNAVGTGTGSLNDDDSKNNISAAYFTSLTSRLSRDADCGDADLITALNNWVEWWNDNQCNAYWEKGPDGYPLPIGKINTKEGTKR